MPEEVHDRKLLRAVYLLCAINAISLAVAVWVTVALSKKSLSEMRALSGIQEDVNSEVDLVLEFDSLIETGQLAEAKEKASKIIAEKPLSGLGHCYLGIAHYHLNEAEEAREHLRTALRIAPGWRDTIKPYLDALGG